MPCDSIRETSVQFLPTSTDLRLLTKAMTAAGYRVREAYGGLTFRRGTVTGTYNAQTGALNFSNLSQRDSTGPLNEIKRAYSEEVVNAQAESYGWSVEWRVNDEGQREAVIERSY